MRVVLAALMLAASAASFSPAQAATYTREEQQNMKLVADFFAALDRAGAQGDMKDEIRAIAEKFMSPDCLEHDTAIQPGREGFIRRFQNIPVARPGTGAPAAPAAPPKVLALMANAELVMRLDTSTLQGADGKLSSRYSVDTYRIQNHRIVEHWFTASSPGGFGAAPAAGNRG
jgi:predicted SnoaL-like aldol condensation-catalyzing enzyme